MFSQAASGSPDRPAEDAGQAQQAFERAYDAGTALLGQHAALPGAPVLDAALDEAAAIGHLMRLCLAQRRLAQGPASSSSEAAGGLSARTMLVETQLLLHDRCPTPPYHPCHAGP